ncbi:hypothetical protein DV738_g1042, partial [Chaetothyriales sp. CBS 135597]
MSTLLSDQNQLISDSRLDRPGGTDTNGHAATTNQNSEKEGDRLYGIQSRQLLSDSSSNDSGVNQRTRHLSIDETPSPNKKRLVGHDLSGLRDSKRTRHENGLLPSSASRIVQPVGTDGTTEKTSRHSNPVLPPEANLSAIQGGERAVTPEDEDRHGSQEPENKVTGMILQLETRPISEEQLVNEVKGIFAGLVMVEKKCVEMCTAQATSNNKHLSNEQWQALIALHRTLLHEHHDFFLASQHPSASPALRRLGSKYAMPARMWRHGIHSFLEILRSRLPESIDHMLSFVYLAYSMMALLVESVPSFSETWIECLGDLARYRMAIEENDPRDREVWANVARMWYNKAADRSPNVGRIQHHLAVLSRPLIVQQLFYYSKALVSVVPFTNARESIMLLLTPFLERPEMSCHKYPEIDSSLVTAFAFLFVKGPRSEWFKHSRRFLKLLDGHISRASTNWKVQGPEVASCLIAGIFGFGTDSSSNPDEDTSYLWRICQAHIEKAKAPRDIQPQEPRDDDQVVEYKAPGNVCANFVLDRKLMEDIRHQYWSTAGNIDRSSGSSSYVMVYKEEDDYEHENLETDLQDHPIFANSSHVSRHALQLWSKATSIIASKVGDRNVIPYLHTALAFLWSLSFVPGALLHIERWVPWSKLVLFLNTLGRSSISDARIESASFPDGLSGLGRQLPEDFPIRGLIWAEFYYPNDFFTKNVVEEDERALELPSHVVPRAERCLWLGVRLSTLGRYIQYDYHTKVFTSTKYAQTLEASVAELDF